MDALRAIEALPSAFIRRAPKKAVAFDVREGHAHQKPIGTGYALPSAVNRTSKIHCENCGASTSANSSGIRYCLDCDLYVCVRCWDSPRDRCQDCVRSTAGTSRRGASIRTLRRADRRLREAARHANTIALIDAATDDPEARIEHACLTIKSATATRAGVQALARLGGQRADQARSLAERLRRHTHEAEAALERAAAALRDGGPTAEAVRQASPVHAHPANPVRRMLSRSYAAPAAVLVVAVVAAAMFVPAWLPGREGNQSARDGTLAGNDSVGAPSDPSPAPGSGDGEVAAGAPAEATLTVDFDAGRMGQGLGPEWVQTTGGADAVELAPFPNAVNRSARLESIDVVGAEACRPVAPTPVRISRMVVEILLSEPTTTAVVIARNVSGSGELRVSLGASDSTFTVDGASPLARGTGLPSGKWLRAEIIADDGQTLWRLDGGSSGTVMETTIDVDALRAIDEVCLAVSTDSTGAAHFDNLTVVIPEEG